MKKALIIVSVCLALAIGVIIYLVTGNDPGPNEDTIRKEERIKVLEKDLISQKEKTAKATEKATGLEEDLAETKAQKPIIKTIYNEERNRVRDLPPDESVKYLAAWLSEADDN